MRISSYGCTWEVWRALKKLELLSAIASSNFNASFVLSKLPKAGQSKACANVGVIQHGFIVCWVCLAILLFFWGGGGCYILQLMNTRNSSMYLRVYIPHTPFLFLMQSDDRIQRLEIKIKLLEQGKAGESCANVLATLRRHLNRPPSLFDPFEAIELLETLVRLARTQAHEKADEYAAALEEVKTRQPTLLSTHLQ